MTSKRQQVVLSVEQALSMSYATLRFVHQGWRVIRVEATPVPGRASSGDPNRYIGQDFGAGKDRHSYYVAPNVGKESIAIDLKQPEGRALLHRLVGGLPVDVFCTNTMPSRHKPLGFDYQTLEQQKEDLIWCSISAMGLAYPDVPGYDPMIQAMCGLMDITGYPDSPPLQCGPPLADLKAGDEAFAQVLLALWERAETGKGKQIDISMARVTVSWLHTFLPLLDMGTTPSELRRAGNEHRQFVPVNSYRCRDGFIYIAVGSDAQWNRFVKQPMFRSLDEPQLASNRGRRENKVSLYERIETITMRYSYAEIAGVLAGAAIPHSPITPIEKVTSLPFVAETALQTVAPNGHPVRLPPPAVDTEHLERIGGVLPFSPSYGEHTDALLAEVGVSDSEIAALRERKVVA